MSHEQVDQIFWYLLLGCVALLIGVTSVTIGQVIRQESARDVRGTVPIKLAWTIVPAVAALIMFWLCWRYAYFPEARQATNPRNSTVHTGSFIQPLSCSDSLAGIMVSPESALSRQAQLYRQPMWWFAQSRLASDDQCYGSQAG